MSRDKDRAVRGSAGSVIGVLAGIMLFLAVGAVFAGLIGDYAEQHNAYQGCEARAVDAPADLVPNGESLSNGHSTSTWPIGVSCHYLMPDGSTYFQQPDWTVTALIWGGAAAGALSLLALGGTAVASAIDSTRSTHR